MQKEDTELAFPCDSMVKALMESGTEGVDMSHVFSGMSLRDYFAASVIGHLLSANLAPSGEAGARYSYSIADAMLAARIHRTE